MKQIKVSEASGVVLDWMVAKCEDRRFDLAESFLSYHEDGDMNYSTNWAQGGPLLTTYMISRTVDHSGLWIAYAGYNLNDEQRHMQCDRSELVAGLRCLVALNLGEVVDVPEELL